VASHWPSANWPFDKSRIKYDILFPGFINPQGDGPTSHIRETLDDIKLTRQKKCNLKQNSFFRDE
jgi:hypothetical protein